MNIDIVNLLYNQFPRDIAIPNSFGTNNFYRKEVTCMRDFQQYITTISGIGGAYTSIYDNTNYPLIDKIVFDLDSNNLTKSLKDTKILSNRLHKKEITTFVIFSGRKGYHVYGLLKPTRLSRDVAGYYLINLQRELSKGLKTIDSHLIGNSRGMIRIINTLNKGRYCTPLPPTFHDWSIKKILEWSKTPHVLEFEVLKYQAIEKIVGEIGTGVKEYKESNIPSDIRIDNLPPLEDLHLFIRPCVLEEMLHPIRKDRGPYHITRISFVSELMFLGYTKKQVLDIFRMIHIKYPIPDFNEEKTAYQISKLYENKIKPYGCVKLKEQGLPCTDCGHKYWW